MRHVGRTTTRSLAILAIALGALVGVSASPAAARIGSASPAGGDGGAPELLPGTLTYLRAISTPATGWVAPRPVPSTRVSSVSATFVVTYVGFPAEARAAFQRAVDIWSTSISSNVPIRINATYKPLPAGVLGGAGPSDFTRDFAGAPRSSTWYPIALANARANRDLSAGADIEAQFQSSGSSWYFGVDGNVPANRMDFTTVVLHEIGHGLGLLDSTDVSGSRGTWGAGTTTPFAYDRLAQSSGGTAVPSIASNSTTLANVLQSNAMRWGGAQAVAANGGQKPYLYSPNPYQSGSSVAHLDETRYPTGTANGLMTPYLDDGEAIHDAGDISLGMLRDMGWTTVGAKGVPGTPTGLSPVAGNGRVHFSWKAPIDTGRQFLTGYRIYRYPNGASVADAFVDVGPSSTSASYSGLAQGTRYRFAIAALNATGTSAVSGKTSDVIPADFGPLGRADDMVRRQYIDFLGRSASSGEVAFWVAAINQGTYRPTAAVTAIAQLSGSADISAGMTRLYSAYFERLPDFGGYTYWIGRRRSGTTPKRASDTFAASAEFQGTYGQLGNAAFVDLVYQNVLHRPADPGGRSYWISKLDRRAVSRGQLMLNFSESPENVAAMRSEAASVLARTAMLRRMPTAAEYADDVSRLDAGDDLGDLVATLYGSAAYSLRFS